MRITIQLSSNKLYTKQVDNGIGVSNLKVGRESYEWDYDPKTKKITAIDGDCAGMQWASFNRGPIKLVNENDSHGKGDWFDTTIDLGEIGVSTFVSHIPYTVKPPFCSQDFQWIVTVVDVIPIPIEIKLVGTDRWLIPRASRDNRFVTVGNRPFTWHYNELTTQISNPITGNVWQGCTDKNTMGVGWGNKKTVKLVTKTDDIKENMKFNLCKLPFETGLNIAHIIQRRKSKAYQPFVITQTDGGDQIEKLLRSCDKKTKTVVIKLRGSELWLAPCEQEEKQVVGAGTTQFKWIYNTETKTIMDPGTKRIWNNNGSTTPVNLREKKYISLTDEGQTEPNNCKFPWEHIELEKVEVTNKDVIILRRATKRKIKLVFTECSSCEQKASLTEITADNIRTLYNALVKNHNALVGPYKENLPYPTLDDIVEIANQINA